MKLKVKIVGKAPVKIKEFFEQNKNFEKISAQSDPGICKILLLNAALDLPFFLEGNMSYTVEVIISEIRNFSPNVAIFSGMVSLNEGYGIVHGKVFGEINFK